MDQRRAEELPTRTLPSVRSYCSGGGSSLTRGPSTAFVTKNNTTNKLTNLGEPIILKLPVPAIEVKNLLTEFDLLVGGLGVLHRPEDVSEAVSLFLPVFLTPRLGAVSGQLLQSLDQLAEVLRLKLLKNIN